jgi:hypothetical protein
VHCRRETREKVRPSLAFSRVSKPHTHITHMLRECTSIVYVLDRRLLLTKTLLNERWLVVKLKSSLRKFTVSIISWLTVPEYLLEHNCWLFMGIWVHLRLLVWFVLFNRSFSVYCFVLTSNGKSQKQEVYDNPKTHTHDLPLSWLGISSSNAAG